MLLTTTTDWIQAIAAAIAIPGAIWAFRLLFKKDKERETEIKSLVSISDQLTRMLKVSENRYRDSKKPHITTDVSFDSNNNILKIAFKNTNPESTIRSYKYELSYNEQTQRYTITNRGAEQFFHIEFPNVSRDAKVLSIDYETEENLVFIQEIFIWSNHGVFGHSSGPIIYEKNSPLYVPPTP